MVINPCSILIMIPKFTIFLFLGFCLSQFMPQNLGANQRGRDKMDDEKVHIFPGTGIFFKNRDPYDDQEAKKWFLEATELQKADKISGALKFYEKFTKRRSDLVLDVEGNQVLIGPESVFRAAMIREKQGDWKKAFDYLQLVAKAYVRYDFDRISSSLMRIAERIATEDLPKKWGVVPRLRSGSEDRERLNQIVELSRGPKYAPRALMILAEIALKDSKDDDAVIALEKLVNFYPEHYLAEKAYFMLGNIHKDFVSGPSYDQGATLHALNYYEDYLILFDELPSKGTDETPEEYSIRKEETLKRKKLVQEGRNHMRESLAQSKLEVGRFVENYGKFFLLRWKELGNQPALQFYNEAITTAPESMAAREAEKRVADLRNE